jgi:hypothetical protein
MRGPIDFIIVGFEGANFKGDILKALADAIENDTISLLALSVIRKDSGGNTQSLDIADLGDKYLVNFVEEYKVDDELVSQEDIDEVSSLVENNTAVGIMVIEHLWAKPLKKALLDANGALIADGRIHPDAAEELSEELTGV